MKKNLFLLLSFPLFIFSQDIEKLNVFLDCNYICDEDFLKREMPYINFMRNPTDSHVQIIIQSQKSASGGSRLSLRFIGLNQFQSTENEYFVNLEPDASEEDSRQEILEMLKKGLFYYLLRSEEAKNFKLSYKKSAILDTKDEIDNWRNWVFRINLNGWLNREKGYSNSNYYSSLSINKISEESKFLSNFRLNNSSTIYDYPDYKLKTETKNSSANFTYVKSLGAKFSAGAISNISRNTFSNYNYKFRFIPSVEYNVYPYDESTKHRLSMLYGVGIGFNDYIDSTIYLKTQDAFALQQIEFKYDNIQKWGNIGFNFYGYQILNPEDFGKYYLNIGTDFNWNVVKGLSVSLWAWATLNRAQISLVKGDISSEDILTRQRELESNYKFNMSFGLSYTFGSTKNNIVNSRF